MRASKAKVVITPTLELEGVKTAGVETTVTVRRP
jgi:hypothetical protein